MFKQNHHQIQNGYFNNSLYFPFGQERTRIKKYVLEQLHSQQIKKNQQILKKFRDEALIRKHSYLTKKLYMQPYYLSNSLDQYAIRENYQAKFTIQDPNQPKMMRYHERLYPTKKTPPPLAKNIQFPAFFQKNYKSLHRQKDNLIRHSDNSLRNHRKYVNKSQIIDKQAFMSVDHINPQKDQSYRDKALKNIKRIARQKRNKIQQPESNVNSLNESKLIEKIQQKQQLSIAQINQLNKKLKLLKKYKIQYNKMRRNQI